jgi:NADPH-dependent 2,4-dienoyl-CoA reductase/sulfur reductase-like enzyme
MGSVAMSNRVLVVGGGPAGLTAAATLAAAGVDVTVVDRERVMGGIPRHTDHLGYGLRDRHRVMRGPDYARRLADDARRAGVELLTGTTVLGVDGTGARVVDERGRREITAAAVVLATGVRERPRAARLVPGDRPSGIFTTGALQQLVLDGRTVGTRAVVVGAEHVSCSAVWTLHHAGCRTVAMVTEHPHHQTTRALWAASAGRYRVPLLAGRRIVEVIGRSRVEAVRLDDGTTVECDTVVFTGGWVPDHELARTAGTVMVPVAGAPATSRLGHTSVEGLFATGNLVHPAETADVCALHGRATAAAVRRWLSDGTWPTDAAPLAVDNASDASDDSDDSGVVRWAARVPEGVTLRVSRRVSARIQVEIDDRAITLSRRRVLAPNRAVVVRLPAGVEPSRVRLVR